MVSRFVVSAVLAVLVGATVHPPLRANGNTILDSKGSLARLACVNWYGAHMERHVVNGLDKRPVTDIVATIASMGFNCVRLVFSNEMYAKNPTLEASAVSANSELSGAHALTAFDAVVEALTSNGVMVILNNHNSDAGWCCSTDDGNGLWHTKTYPTNVWQQMWVDLAKRYKANPNVIGFDLRNELRDANNISPTWGDGNTNTDWKRAAEDCGNAVLEANSDLLIFVEGLSYANSLLGLRAQEEVVVGQDAPAPSPMCTECYVQLNPVSLSLPNRLVYSGHWYSWQGFKVNNFDAFAKDTRKSLTYVTTANQTFTAPFWLGEFGTNSADKMWGYTMQILKENPNWGWSYWALDGYKHSPGQDEDESFGILEQDYVTVRHAWKLADLQKVMSSGLASIVPVFV